MGAIECIVQSGLADEDKVKEIRGKVNSLVASGKNPLEAEALVKHEFITDKNSEIKKELDTLKKKVFGSKFRPFEENKIPTPDLSKITEAYRAKSGELKNKAQTNGNAQPEKSGISFATYRGKSINSVAQDTEIRNSPEYKTQQENVQKVADGLGIKITNSLDTWGGYVDSKTGKPVQEVSNVITVDTTPEKAQLMAAILGKTAPEIQDSVLVGTHDPNGKGSEYTIHTGDFENAQKSLEFLKSNNLEYFTIDKNTGNVIILDPDGSSEDNIINFTKDLQKNNIYGGTEYSNVNANFVGQDQYDNIIKKGSGGIQAGSKNGFDINSFVKEARSKFDQSGSGSGGQDRGYSALPESKRSELKKTVEDYNKEFGGEYKIPKPVETSVDKLDVNKSKSISDAYEKLPEDDSANPAVKKAYTQLGKEIQTQYDYITKKLGIKVEFTPNDPYVDSKAMVDDVAKNKHLFAYNGESDHPFLGEKTKDENGVSLNEKFRAVHDYFGHAVEGNQFGKLGEERAWVAHSKMFSEEAQKALTTETRGQNSWVNFSGVNDEAIAKINGGNKLILSGDNEAGQKLLKEGQDEFKFATQKVALLPDEFNSIKDYVVKPNENIQKFNERNSENKVQQPAEVKINSNEGAPKDALPATEDKKAESYSEKAKRLADIVRSKEIPQWLNGSVDKNIVKSGFGLTGDNIKEAFAKSIESVGKLLDKGVELKDAISQQVEKFINDIKSLGAKDLKPEFEKKLREGFADESNKRFGSEAGSDEKINAAVTQLRDLGFDDNEIKDSLKQSGYNDSEIDDAINGGLGNGTVNTSASTQGSSSNAIHQAEIKSGIRDRFGLKSYQKVVITDKELNDKADEIIASGYDVRPLIKRLISGDTPDAIESVILKKLKPAIAEEVAKNPTKANLKRALDFARALDTAGAVQGREFRLRRDLQDNDNSIEVGKQSLSDFLVREMRLRGQDDLTGDQILDVEKRYNKLKDAYDSLLEKTKNMAATQAADQVANTVRIKRRVNKTHDDYVKERASLVDKLKQQAEEYKAAGKKMGIVADGGAESFIITAKMAKTVGELAKSYIAEGVNKLTDLVDQVHESIKDILPQIKKDDVVDIIAGAYNAPKQTRDDVVKRIAALRKEAVQQSELAKARRDAATLKSIKRIYSDKIDKLKESLRTKSYENMEAAVKSTPVKLDREAMDLKDRYIRLKEEEERRIAKLQFQQRSRGQKLGINLLEALNIPRTLMSSVDFSAVLRQAVIPTIAHPIMASHALAEMFQQTFSQQRFDRWLYDLKENPYWEDVMRPSKLYISDPNDSRLAKKEEAFMNNIVERVPILGNWFVKGSERAYISYLNKMRVDLFRRGAELLEGDGKTFETAPEAYKSLASWVNNATGRGGMNELMEMASPVLSAGIFAPRLIASRLNLLGLTDLPALVGIRGSGFYGKLDPTVRKMAWADMAKFIGFGTTVLALTKLFASDNEDDPTRATVETDPRSSDFGKIKVGDTRYDIWGGFQPYVRVAAQVFAGSGKSTSTGEIYSLDDGSHFGQTRGSAALNFIRGKLAPIPSMILDFGLDRTITGQKILFQWGANDDEEFDPNKEITLKDVAINHFLPLAYSDIHDLLTDPQTDPTVLAGMAAAIFGIGVQTYSNK